MSDLASLDGLQSAIDGSPCQKALGLRIVSFDADSGEVEIALPFGPAAARGAGGDQVHGGAIATLIDVAGDYALAVRLGYFVPTIDLRVDYLRPAIGTLHAKATIVRCGRTLGVVDIAVVDNAEKTVAVGRALYSTRAD